MRQQAPVAPAPMSASDKAELIEAGLMEPDASYAPTPPKYEPVTLGDRVVITTKMFPWVKHYKAGDMGLITHISNNEDPLGIDVQGGHKMHVISIDQAQDKARNGQRAALFRWEFEKVKP